MEPWLVSVTDADWLELTLLVVPDPMSLPVHDELMLVVMPAAELGEDKQGVPAPMVLERMSVPL